MRSKPRLVPGAIRSINVGGSPGGPGSGNGDTHASVSLVLIEPDKLMARRASECMGIDSAAEQRSLV